jgi:transitional endoplasmic reticulum ATPase
MSENFLKLKVIESLQEDIDKGIVRLTNETMDKLGIVSGDLIEIKEKSSVVLKALRSIKKESSEDIIRLDGTTRSNIGASMGDYVEVSKEITVNEAKNITLSPNQEGIRFSDDPKEYFHTKLLHKSFKLGQKTVIDVFGTRLNYVISKTNPKGYVLVTPSTRINISEVVYTEDMRSTGISYEDIGGLKNEVELVREMVELPMKHPEVFEKLGIGAPKGVLLTGPPGTGKTLLAKAVANETESSFFSVAGPEIMSKYYGESEKHIREVFEKAEKSTPAIIFIDEIDSIAPKRGEGIDQTEKRIVAQLLSLMDGLKSRGQIVVMAATNRPDDIDEALRRPGRFDRELKINPPSEKGRKEILQIHTRGMPLGKNVDFDEIARRTIGYTGADLEVLCKEAALKSIKPYFNDLKNMQDRIPTNILDKIKVSRVNFIDALKFVEPSAMREVLINKPNVSWNDVGGLEKTKEKLRELVELPLIRPDLYSKAGIKPSKGILLTGPPGTGKTLLAKAVANESNANFISIKGPELVSKWVGESEKRIREIFKKARQVSPCIIFFDEFDSISKLRGSSMSDSTERIVNQLLTELDGVEELEKVIVIAATNRKDLIDPSLLRPGRIDAVLNLDIPDEKTREKIFEVHTRNMPIEKDLKIKDYVKKTENWTGADIEFVCRTAGINAIKRAYKLTSKDKDNLIITKKDFDNSLKEIAESLGKILINKEIKENEIIKKKKKKGVSKNKISKK